MHLRRKIAYFQYHLKCRHFNDKRGDIEISQMESSQHTEYACYFLKLFKLMLMTRFETYFDAFKKKDSLFSISPEMSAF